MAICRLPVYAAGAGARKDLQGAHSLLSGSASEMGTGTLRKATNGWPLLATTATALAIMSVAALLSRPGIHGLHAVLRATARTSLLFFLLAFSASAIWKLWPGSWSRWQWSNRRYLGLSFAASHTIHLAAITGVALAAPHEFLQDNDAWSLTIGAVAYAFIFAMAATSFDRAVMWLGPRRWKILHTVGSYYLCIAFLIVLVTFALDAPRYWVGVASLLVVLCLRLIARFAKSPAPVATGQPAGGA